MKAGAMQGFGTYQPDERGRLCYLPPVPPFPKLDDVWSMLEQAGKAVEAFDRALGSFPVPDIVGKLFARLDAVHSSGAEGSTTTFTDLMAYQTALNQAKDPDDAREVAAAAEAFDAMAASGSDLIDIVLGIHRRLFERAKDPLIRAAAGKWKNHPNGTHDPDSLGGIFYYCAPASLPAAVPQWVAFTNAEDGKPELLRQALSHWMFEHIHPVPDGNGRVGRLLVPILMRRKGTLRNACAFLGEAVHLNKEIYIDALKAGRIGGELGGWSRVFFSMVAQTAASNLTRLEKLGTVYGRWLSLTKTVRSHSIVHDLVPWVLTKPSFTVRDALAVTGGKVSFQAMNTAISRLSELGIITMVRTGGKERLFAAQDVIDLFDPVSPNINVAATGDGPPTPG